MTLLLCGGSDSLEYSYSAESLDWASQKLSTLGIPHEKLLTRELTTFSKVVESGRFDRFLLLFHGGWGEDGQAQRVLEVAKLPYSGCRSVSAASCMNKRAAKRLVNLSGVDVPAEMTSFKDISVQPHKEFIVKPNMGGSSIGVELYDTEHILENIRNFEFKDTILVEERVPGEVVTIPVLSCEPEYMQIFPALVIWPHQEAIYGFETKSKSDRVYANAEEVFAPRTLNMIEQCAAQAFRALECHGIVRFDFIVSEFLGVPRVTFLEANSIPGLGDKGNLASSYSLAGKTAENLLEDLLHTIS